MTEPVKIHEHYVQRIKARLAQPTITVEDARDGMLDCYVSTYHEGLAAGLRGLVGVEANPDEVARVAAGMFRKRLKNHGVSFEAPTVDALAAVKEEVDQEFHFAELPVEMRSIHDRVCSLMLSKAEGTLEHHGDQSVLKKSSPPRIAETHIAETQQAPSTASRPAMSSPVVTSAPPTSTVSSRGRARTALSLRAALTSHFEDLIEQIQQGTSVDELEDTLSRGHTLLQTLRHFE